LGSPIAVYDGNADMKERLSFCTWGNHRDYVTLNALAPCTSPSTETVRGYTGHEHRDAFGIIHMNGRVYDPQLGRMLQADPFIQAPGNTQSYNRYTYVMNNPLGYTDPSGYNWKDWVAPVIAVAAIVACSGNVQCGIEAYMAIGATSGGASAAANGGDFVQGAIVGGISGAAFYGMGVAVRSEHFAVQAFALGTVGGAASAFFGGDFGHGFISAGAGALIPGGAGGNGTEMMVLRTIGRAIIGGTVSELTGGKFANGAATAAFVSIVTEGAVAANRSNSYDPISPDIAVPDVETAEIALNVDAELIDSPYAVKGPGNLPAYSRSGIIEEVVVRAQYTGAKLLPLTPASGIMFYGAAYRSIDPIGNQAARVLGWQLKFIACVSFMTVCSAYGAAETTANFVQNPNPMDATSLGYELYKARFGGSHPVNQAVDMAIGEFLGALPR
jgi:RHS repeat-associated protein